MPSREVHEKYSRLMGIPIDVAREVNRFIDDPRWHDFFDSALDRSSMHLGLLGGRVIVYGFQSALFYTPTYEPFRQRIEAYGGDGFRAFFLHMILDLIERNMRSGEGFALLKLDDIDGLYRDYVEEVGEFLGGRIDEVLADVREYIDGGRNLTTLRGG